LPTGRLVSAVPAKGLDVKRFSRGEGKSGATGEVNKWYGNVQGNEKNEKDGGVLMGSMIQGENGKPKMQDEAKNSGGGMGEAAIFRGAKKISQQKE